MLKLKKSHFPRAISRKYYEEDPDAVALETGVESEVISGMQQALTQADDDDPFGDCVLCRQPIAEGRLKHLPWAAYCSTCDPEGGKPGAGFELSKAA